MERWGMVRRRLSAAVLAAVALLAGACSADRATGPERTDQLTLVEPTPSGSVQPGRASSGPGDPGSTNGPPRTTRGPGAGSGFVSHDDDEVGSNGPLYLRPDVPRMVVEVEAVPGREPSASTLNLLVARLHSVVGKPGGVTVTPTHTIPAHGDGTWTLDQLRAAENRYRTTHSSASAASMYLMYVDGKPPQEGALGVTFSASATAIFVDQIASSATLLVSAASIERATTVHEAGHMLSLVNLGYTSPRHHEDPDHRGHSSDPDSVMYWAVDNVGVATLLGGHTTPPTDFDAADRADLAAIQSGELP